MQLRIFSCTAGLALPCVLFACGQQHPIQSSPDPSHVADAGLEFTFPLHPGQAPHRLKLELDANGYVKGIEVFAPGKSTPLQTLATCGGTDETLDDLTHDTDEPLLKHADLNFDGFEDIQLMYMYVPHLGKRLDCVYLFDPKTGTFAYSKALTGIGVSIEAHPGDQTLTTHEDWMFGPWQDSTYRWIGGKPVLVEQVSLLGSWGQSDNPCGFTYTCSKRIGGKMVDTLTKKICKPEEMDDLPKCPSASAAGAPQAPPKAR